MATTAEQYAQTVTALQHVVAVDRERVTAATVAIQAQVDALQALIDAVGAPTDQELEGVRDALVVASTDLNKTSL